MDKKEKEYGGHVDATTVEKQFVRKYKQLPHLWNPNHPDYNNRFKRNAGYDALLPIFRQYMPKATRFHVRQKINILRSCYRKERRKLLASSTIDADGNIVYSYVPNLWKYHAMKFLDEDDDEIDETGAEYVEEDVEYVEAESGNEEPDTSKIETSPIYLEDEHFDEDLEDQKPFKRKRSRNTMNHSYQEIYTYRESDVLEKEFNAIGANVACKLQRMTVQQRYRAELLINKVLIKGLKESLTESTDLADMWLMQRETSNYDGVNTNNKDHSKEDSNDIIADQSFDLIEN